MLVIVDAGHGGKDPGAVGKQSKEKDITLAISLLLREELRRRNVSVYLTRDKDIFLSLEDRCRIANNLSASYFISVHINSAVNLQAKGYEVYCYRIKNNNTITKAGILAQSILDTFRKNLVGFVNRGVKEANFYVLKYTKMPAVLVECGFISNLEEEKRLMKNETQLLIAQSIAEGLIKASKV